MKEFFTELLLAIGNFVMLLVTIFVLIGVPVVFLLEERQCMSNFNVVLNFIMVSLWSAWLPDYFKNIGHHSTSLYNRVKGEADGKRDN